MYLHTPKIYSKNGFYKIRNLVIPIIILIILLSINSEQFYAYGQLAIQPTGYPCILCFYTVEGKAIELGLTPRRADTATEHLNFDFIQPVNGNLTQTAKGLLYTPNKNSACELTTAKPK